MSGVTDMSISAYNTSTGTEKWGWRIMQALPAGPTSELGTYIDDQNLAQHYYTDGVEWAVQSRVKLAIWDYDGSGGTPYSDGTYVTVTFNLGTALIYIPAEYGGNYYHLATRYETDGYYYVSTFNNYCCTDLSHAAPTPTP